MVLISVILVVNKVGKISIFVIDVLCVVLVVEMLSKLILVVVLKLSLNRKLSGYICCGFVIRLKSGLSSCVRML